MDGQTPAVYAAIINNLNKSYTAAEKAMHRLTLSHITFQSLVTMGCCRLYHTVYSGYVG